MGTNMDRVVFQCTGIDMLGCRHLGAKGGVTHLPGCGSLQQERQGGPMTFWNQGVQRLIVAENVTTLVDVCSG